MQNRYYQYSWAESNKCMCTHACFLPHRHWNKILSPVLARKSLSALLCFYRNTSLFLKLKLILDKLLCTKNTRVKTLISILYPPTSQCCHLFSSYSLLNISPMGCNFPTLGLFLLVFLTYSATNHYLCSTLVLHPVPWTCLPPHLTGCTHFFWNVSQSGLYRTYVSWVHSDPWLDWKFVC